MKKMRQRNKIISLALLVLVLVIVNFLMYNINHSRNLSTEAQSGSEVVREKSNIKTDKARESAPITTNSRTFESATLKVTRQIDWPAIQAGMQKVIDNHPELEAAASFENIKTGEKVAVGGDKLFVAASTIKVLVAIDFFMKWKRANTLYKHRS